jgi:hypothetical protein
MYYSGPNAFWQCLRASADPEEDSLDPHQQDPDLNKLPSDLTRYLTLFPHMLIVSVDREEDSLDRRRQDPDLNKLPSDLTRDLTLFPCMFIVSLDREECHCQ